ncbi:MAG TPA: DUF3460 family protein [Usitatibacteraceae bacterium]|jgi:hypothetical protein|nr:DUF3460 family protein [Usitatibacteraceae bacterium]HQY46077.1 DUF3460 family protein [Usitatibacteraceae bacterium]HRA23327.1 DUF3460 family protein [Usitatibacteraceae bacterium]
MGYESEATRFLRELHASHPELRELRSRNRATWWDRPQDAELQRERDAARVPQGAYVYFPNPEPTAPQGGEPA